MSVVKEINPPTAWDILQENALATLIDVRTSMEFEYVGHPVGAINIPWKEAPDWQENTGFVEQVRQALHHRFPNQDTLEELPILTICRSGARSMAAAGALEQQGFKSLYNIEQGFEGDRDGAKHRSMINGWRFHNLPWEQG